MTYRGVYRDGIVVLEGDVDLRNGVSVEVNLSKVRAKRTAAESRETTRQSRKPAKASKPAKSGKKSKPLDQLPAFGIWKDRWPKSMSSAEIARQLRADVSRRTR